MMTTNKQTWRCVIYGSRNGEILGTVYVGADTVAQARTAGHTQAKLIGIKKRVRVAAYPWSIANDVKAVSQGFVRRVSE
jgi:hypothetical protein